MEAIAWTRTLVEESLFVVSVATVMCWMFGAASGAALAQGEDYRWGKEQDARYKFQFEGMCRSR